MPGTQVVLVTDTGTSEMTIFQEMCEELSDAAPQPSVPLHK